MVRAGKEREEHEEQAQGGHTGFTVTDRRSSVRQEEGGEEAPEEYRGPRAPTYVEELEGKLAANDQRLRELIASYKKLQGEMDGFRARLHRDLERRVEQEKASLLAPFLSVIDDLARALAAAEAADDFAPLREGIELIRSQVREQLAKNGVVAIEAVAQPFDPETHEAVEVVPVQDPGQDGVVLKELAKGYMLHEQLVRPAKVAVGRWSGHEEERAPEPGAEG